MNDTQITMPGFEPPTEQERLRIEWERLQRIIEAEAAAEERKDAAAHKGADPKPILADFNTAMQEIMLMAERGSRPAAIAIVADAARRYALRLEAATGIEAFFTFAEMLKEFAQQLKAEDAQEVQDDTRTVRSVVFTPDTIDPATGERIPGQEFILPDEIAAYKKASPFAAAEWERTHPQPTQADIIKSNIGRVSFQLDALKSPEDALTGYDNIPTGYYRRYAAAHFARLVQEVSRRTGADPQQIADKDKRTPEQQRLLTEAAAREQIARMEAFLHSNYMQAVNALDPLKGSFQEGEAAAEGAALGVKEYAVLYFFAAHEDIKATAPAGLTPEQITELTGIYNRLDAFFATQQEAGTDPTPETLHAFIEQENPDPNAAEIILRNLPELQGLRPKSHTMPNSKLMNALQTGDLINTGDTQLIVIPEDKKRRQKEITAYTMVSYDPGETSITITEANLTEYERQVSDAVISLWLEADKRKLPPVFTPDMIFRSMPGGGDKPSPQQKGAITKAIEKFRRLHITLDATEEMRKRGLIGERATFKIDNFYLSATHAEYKVKMGGQTVNAYKIDTEPIMLTYSKMTKQLLTVPAKYIAIEKVKGGKPSGELIAMTPTRQAMTGYIIRRIKIMQHDMEKAKDRKRSYDIRRSRDKALEDKPLAAFREQSPVILFDTLFKDVGITEQTRDRALDNRNFCFDVLDYQIAVGNISGYKKKTAGRQITGVEIIL